MVWETRPTVPMLAALAFLLAACSTGTSDIEAGGPGTGVEGDSALQAVLEPANAMVEDFGESWEQVDRWYTEGSMTSWSTGCSDFDRLGDIFNYGTPETVVWQHGDDQLFQRTDDFGWDAADFADTVEQLPGTCPEVEVGSLSVTVSAVDPNDIASNPDRITADDRSGRVVAIKLDAYPRPSPETDVATPEFEPGRSAWMVVATRHNVVSQLVYSPEPELSTTDRLNSVVEAQIDALVSAPVEATGPFEKADPPPAFAPGTFTDVELFLDSNTCANDGHIDVNSDSGDVRWRLSVPVPVPWRYRSPIRGDLVVDGIEGRFTAYAGPPPVPGDEDETTIEGSEPAFLESFTVGLTTGAVPSVCETWDEPENVPDSSGGPLDCDDRPTEETRIPDEGQDPLELAVEANPQVVEVRPLQPLVWAGFDGGGNVVVELYLGDAANADWQIITCAQP